VQPRWWSQPHFTLACIDLATEPEQHALGVIAGDGRLDHSGDPFRKQAGQQHRRFDLRARYRQLVTQCR
jgi:hypothetical protein